MKTYYEEVPVTELPEATKEGGFSDFVFVINEGHRCMGYYDFDLKSWMTQLNGTPIKITPTVWLRELPADQKPVASSVEGCGHDNLEHDKEIEGAVYCKTCGNMYHPASPVSAPVHTGNEVFELEEIAKKYCRDKGFTDTDSIFYHYVKEAYKAGLISAKIPNELEGVVKECDEFLSEIKKLYAK